MTDPHFRPVVAIDVDGVLRVTPPAPNGAIAPGVFGRVITMRKGQYPTYPYREPTWDEHDEWTTKHWFSGVGAAWVQSLLERGIDVVWATTWQQYVHTYFAQLLGLPELPVAVQGPGRVTETSPSWKAHRLARQFDGRPLLWVDDNILRETTLEELRRSEDRVLTHFHWVRKPRIGITIYDIAEMDEWVELTRTPQGQQELHQRRQRDLAHARAALRRSIWGSEANYRAWRPIRARLHTELGLSPDDIDTLADYARNHPENINPVEVADLLTECGIAKDIPTGDIVGILREYRPRTRRQQ